MYVLLCIFFVKWHFSATLTEVFPCFFLSCKANPRVYLPKTGARSAIFLISELCCSMYCLCRLCCSMYCLCRLCCSMYCLCQLCCSLYCLCANVHCTTATGGLPQLQLHISYHISHHIISYQNISYHVSLTFWHPNFTFKF